MMPYIQSLSRKSLYILGLVAIAFFGSAYMTWINVQETGASLTVEKQRDTSTATLRQLGQAINIDAARADLAAAQAQLKDIQFPEQAPNVDLVALVVKASKDSGVELSNVQVLAVEQEKLGANNYTVMRQRLNLKGTPPQISSFVNRLEQGQFRTLVFNNVSLVPKGNIWEVRMDLYTYSIR